jgi:tartrate-resistant acid phosphatase type 5
MIKTGIRRFLPAGVGAGLLLILMAGGWVAARPAQTAGTMHFAVIGDYGSGSTNERDVANLVNSWNPDFVITLGDNNYSSGAASTIDKNIGQFYHQYIAPYRGSYGAGDTTNAFWPSLGNHDWMTTNAQPYLDYFTLPANERYYDFVEGPVHFYALDSDSHEPDGNSATSVQGQWLQARLAQASEPWKVVYFHHAPYSSGAEHGSNLRMQWPFQQWGASVVLAGHDHDYERILVNGFPYFVNGLGGESLYTFGQPIPGSQVRFSGDYGAMRVDAATDHLTFQFVTRANAVIDTYTISAAGVTVTPAPTGTPVGATATPTSTPAAPATDTPGVTPTAAGTSTPPGTATRTATATGTATATNTATAPPATTATATNTPTATAAPPADTATPPPVPTATPMSVIFSDGFESGDMSQWTTTRGLTVQAAITHGGRYAAQGNTTNGDTYAKKTLPATYTDAYARIYFNLVSYSSQVNLLRFRTAGDTSLAYLFVSTAGNLGLRNDVSGITLTSGVQVSSGWHALEFHTVVNGATSQTEVWLDGVAVNELTTATDLGSQPVGRLQIGEVNTGRTYNVVIDDVAFAQQRLGAP